MAGDSDQATRTVIHLAPLLGALMLRVIFAFPLRIIGLGVASSI